MSNDHQMYVVFYALAAILPISALMTRRMPWRRALLLLGVWIAIFAVATIIAGVGRAGLADRIDQVKAMIGSDDQQVTGGTVRIRMAEDGHFWATAKINGVARRMLVDSGATTTALSVGTADAAHIARDSNGFASMLETANGRVAADVATADTLTIGSISARQLHVVVSPAFGNTDVLGMNFLSRLGGWRVEGKTLILTASTGTSA